MDSGAGGGLEVGSAVWVADRDAVWKAAIVASTSGGVIKVEIKDASSRGSPQIIEIAEIGKQGGPAQLHVRNDALKTRQGCLQFNDLSQLPLLHEPALLHALQVRFEDGIVYTSTGPVLLAVNPFRKIPDLYGAKRLTAFLDRVVPADAVAAEPTTPKKSLRREEEQPAPHIFGIACLAYEGVWRRGDNQTVLISGESGAGKTETTKFVMRFLALAGAGGAESSMSDVERRVLGSIPLLEALGNAKTLRNDNSSRFGKYIELQFRRGSTAADATAMASSEAPRLLGAHTHTYLLEKVRVTGQQSGERSFHVFYQMLAVAAQGRGPANGDAGGGAVRHSLGGEAGSAAVVELRGAAGYKPQDFEYLHHSGCYNLGADVDEVKAFDESMAALLGFGVPVTDMADLLGALMAVLHIGNVAFKSPANNSEGSEPASWEGSLSIACGLLGVAATDLSRAVCSRTIKAPGQGVIHSPQPVAKAVEGRDALARHLYAAIFAFVVEQVNATVSATSSRAEDGSGRKELPCIGVLDIFGFEFFKTNSLEQLLINYTNELLQKHFNTVIFEHEEALYKREQIQWDPMAFPDNTAIVDLIGKGPTGLLPALDEECSIIGGSAEGWCSKLNKEHGKSNHFKVVLRQKDNFVVKHFAGPVEYASKAFLEKNRDLLGADLVACLKNSSNDFVRQRFHAHDRIFGTQSSATTGRRVSKAKIYTVASEFRDQLQDLMQRIQITEPHFVRCIKPNPQSLPNAFDRISVAEQLRYQGVLQAIEVSRAGFPLRLRHRQGTLRFKSLAAKGVRNQLEALVTRRVFDQAIRLLLSSLSDGSSSWVAGLEAGDWAVGLSLVFFKRRAVEIVGGALSRRRDAAACQIQAAWRRTVARRRFLELIASTRRLQAAVRGHAARRRAAAMRRERAATRLENAWRSKLARRELFRHLRAVAVLQAWFRARRCRAAFLRTMFLIVRMQRWNRRTVIRLRARRKLAAAVRVQSAWRGSCGRHAATEQLANHMRRRLAARRLLNHWRSKVCDRLVPSTCRRVRTRLSAPGKGDASSSDPVESVQDQTRPQSAAVPLLANGGALKGSGSAFDTDTDSVVADAMFIRRLEASSVGELLAATAALRERCQEIDREVGSLRDRRQALFAQVIDLERWTCKGILVRFAGRFLGDSCGPREEASAA